MSQENIDFISQHIYANIQTGNLEGVMAALADNVVWNHHGPREQIPFSGHWEDKRGAGQMLQTFAEVTEPVNFDVKGVVASGDQVIFLIDEGCKVRTTGKSYSTFVAQIWTIQNGKIVQFDELYDSYAVAEAFRS